ncbi:hypothetical protein [Natronomonas sp. LN261]|uniref:hypothetical protein n=1 Tax=Natronomonas sp. LN261 TaxID=2750669 RepID=UPI0015EF6FB2|nr:hypothetical protein [Natronomonas sp. LN261]
MSAEKILPGGVDREALADVFDRTDGNISACARELDVGWTTAARAAEEVGLYERDPCLARKLQEADS